MRMVETLRLGSEHRRFGDRVVRVRSGETFVGYAENFVADFQIFHPVADRINLTGKVRAQSKGKRLRRTLCRLRIKASHGPIPAALTRTTTSPLPGSGLGKSSMEMTSGEPNSWTRTAFI